MPSYTALPVSVLGVPALVAARLTLPASTADETVKGSGRQVRHYRAPTLRDLADLVARELREHALAILTAPGRGSGARARGARAAEAADAPMPVGPTRREIAQGVIDALGQDDLPRAVRLHAEGFGLPVALPPALGGIYGDAALMPTPRWATVPDRRKVVLEEDAEGEGDVATRETTAAVDRIGDDAPVGLAAPASDESGDAALDAGGVATVPERATPRGGAGRRVKRGLATAA